MLNKKIAISFIGTGKYLNFFPQYYETFMEYFAPECYKHFFVFTDGQFDDDVPENITLIPSQEIIEISQSDYSASNWYNLMYNSIGGLRRFGELLRIKDQLSEYDWYIYFDADMYCCPKTITYEEFFDDEKPFFGVQHPTYSNYWKKHGSVNRSILPFDRNELSLACVSEEMQKDDVYLQGCVWGGKIPDVFKLIHELDNRVKNDLENNVMAKAHDESHLNRYRMENIEDFHVLSPCFAKPGNYPDYEFTFPEARIIHSPIDKHKILNA
jgi:hypothetical protein